MTCGACAVVRQVTYNGLLALDLGLNTALLGQPRETVSRRTARARAAGSRAATIFCGVLTWIGNRFGADRDHCDWAAADGPSIATEIWHWSTPDDSATGNG
ncbi:MAG: hypothetical protein ACRYG8_22620 [Janthinobacterium lividum]